MLTLSAANGFLAQVVRTTDLLELSQAQHLLKRIKMLIVLLGNRMSQHSHMRCDFRLLHSPSLDVDAHSIIVVSHKSLVLNWHVRTSA